jgi:type VI secretion system secreted protein Hcp
MPNPCYMTLTGVSQGKIDGSVEVKGKEKTIELFAVDDTINIPKSPQTGLPTGKRVHNPYTVTKQIDEASPKLFQALCQGEQFSDVTINWYRTTKDGKEEKYFTTKMEKAIIVSIRTWMPEVLDPTQSQLGHMEDVSFTYEKITWTWEPKGISTTDSLTGM